MSDNEIIEYAAKCLRREVKIVPAPKIWDGHRKFTDEKVWACGNTHEELWLNLENTAQLRMDAAVKRLLRV